LIAMLCFILKEVSQGCRNFNFMLHLLFLASANALNNLKISLHHCTVTLSSITCAKFEMDLTCEA